MQELSPPQRPRTTQRSAPGLSFDDRLYIIQTVNGLPIAQFEELCFALNTPKEVMPANTASQGERSKALLDWAEGPTGPGLMKVDQGLQTFVPKVMQPEQAAQPKAFAISGEVGNISPGELAAIVQLLRQKTGDDSIEIAFFTEGSIKLVLNGSPEGLEKLQKLYDSGELAEVLDGRSVEYVHSIESDTTEARKSRLVQVIRLRKRSIRTTISDFIFVNNTATASIAVAGTAIAIGAMIGGAHLSAAALMLYKDLIAEARTRTQNIDLRRADLSGTNLRGLDLRGIDLEGTDLTHADVTGTLFGHNPGLTESDKLDLQQRGAIFQEPPSSDAPSLVQQ